MPHRHLLRAFQILLHHPAVRTLVTVAAGTECHLVGGVLRDKALGLPVHDIDTVVAGQGREIAERLAKELPARLVLLGGKEFAAYRLVGEDVVIDLWDREETTLHQDLARRDFTVNAFALDARTGELIDPFGGVADLQRHLLRATTPESFTGDPLRVLRLPRLLLRLPGFAAEPGTVVLARQCASRITRVAAERVRDEIQSLFEHPEAHRGLAFLVALDLYPGLWLGTPGTPGRTGGAMAELECLGSRIRDLRNVDSGFADTVDARIARIAATFAHLPEEDGRRPVDVLTSFQEASYVTRQTAEDVAFLLGLEGMPRDEVGRRRFLHRAGRLWTTAVCSLGARMSAQGDSAALDGWRREIHVLADIARREGAILFDPPRLLTGAEIQELLGIPPGPEMGRVLSTVRQAQIDGIVRTKEEAMRFLGERT
jgi:tRNA nucleotidyltransferase (CCA-adding enzyme)